MFFYAVATLILIPILFLIGLFFVSLFEKELFTQDIFMIGPVLFLFSFGVVLDLIAILFLSIFQSGLKLNEEKDIRVRSGVKYISFIFLFVFCYIISDLLIFQGDGTFIFFFWTAIILCFFILNWKIIDIPAKVLEYSGNNKGLFRSRLSALPFLAFLFSFMALIFSFKFEDAPVETIVMVYLEILFSITVLINIFNILGITNQIDREIVTLRKQLS